MGQIITKSKDSPLDLPLDGFFRFLGVGGNPGKAIP